MFQNCPKIPSGCASEIAAEMTGHFRQFFFQRNMMAANCLEIVALLFFWGLLTRAELNSLPGITPP